MDGPPRSPLPAPVRLLRRPSGGDGGRLRRLRGPASPPGGGGAADRHRGERLPLRCSALLRRGGQGGGPRPQVRQKILAGPGLCPLCGPGGGGAAGRRVRRGDLCARQLAAELRQGLRPGPAAGGGDRQNLGRPGGTHPAKDPSYKGPVLLRGPGAAHGQREGGLRRPPAGPGAGPPAAADRRRVHHRQHHGRRQSAKIQCGVSVFFK